VSNHVSHSFARKLLASGVTVAEWVVMREMFDDETTSPGVLAERIGMTRGGVSKLVDRLVAKKFVTRRDRSDDRRFQSIALTATGRRLIPQLAALADQNDDDFFHPLSMEERAALIATMKKLVQAHGLQTLPTE
jgi:DNA-binding MarR family transcriptional regulator